MNHVLVIGMKCRKKLLVDLIIIFETEIVRRLLSYLIMNMFSIKISNVLLIMCLFSLGDPKCNISTMEYTPNQKTKLTVLSYVTKHRK